MISIVIVNWNSRQYLQRCLDSLRASVGLPPHEIIVVDSGSFDGCAEMLAEGYPEVRFIQSAQNLGFGRANNLGVRYAKGELLLLLNPDTEVGGDALARLHRDFLAAERPGIMGCRLVGGDGRLQLSCVQSFPTLWNQAFDWSALQRRLPGFAWWTSAASYARRSGTVRVDAVIGACMVMRKELFVELGGFSSDYFMYGEDIDLCFRASRRGLRNYYAVDVEIVHHGAGSSQQAPSRFASVMMRESIRRLLGRMRGRRYAAAYRLAMGVGALGRLAALGLYSPVALLRRRAGRLAASVSKWVGVLRWSVGAERWVLRYDSLDAVAPVATL